ncbi:MAG TPA: aldo/keto reductase [Pseudoalteromonas prydzensis]|uniref:Aldo/keto reductase n=3 Tax=root TaxID=1 RepID=A0A7V1CW84_9GAMM|nr:aldo/keto reductase [Pseudoalteromonas prydzensis]HEA15481.1 aldo/keto reductase [Pseudoalteromonas prydzensis]
MKIALGTVQFGINYGVSNTSGQTSQNQIQQIIELAKTASITTIDTASAYGDAEARLGQCGLSSFKVVSKIKPITSQSNVNDCVTNDLDKTLKDLQLPAIYGLLLHNAQDFNHYPELTAILKNKKAQGLVEKIGLSLYSPTQISDEMLCFADLVQIPVNIFDQRFIKTGALDRLKSKNIEVHTRSAFLQGLLLMSEGDWPAYFNPIKPQLERFHQLAKKLNTSPLSLALNYVMNITQIDKVVVGINNLAQLEGILINIDNPNYDIDFEEISLQDEHFINPANWQIS